MNKQLVFLAETGADGGCEKDVQCAHRGGLSGSIIKLEYIPDARVPYESGAAAKFSAANSGAELLSVVLDGREIWQPEGLPVLVNEPIRVVITNAGKGKSGSFVITAK